MTRLVARLLGVLAMLWGVAAQVFTVVDTGVLSMVTLAYVSLWGISGIGLVLLKEWGRRCALIAATVGLVLLLVFSIGTTAMVFTTGFAGFHMSRWGWVPWVGLMLACHIGYGVILTRVSMKAEFSRKTPTST